MGVPDLSAFTVAQKAALCLGSDFWHTAPVPEHGVRGDGACPTGRTACAASPTAATTSGIGGSLPATCFPPAVRARLGVGPGAGPRGRRGDRRARRGRRASPWCSGPGINIKRSPLCGRNFEYVSEDPLPGRACSRAGARARACRARASAPRVKHFAANNQETDRLRVSAEVDERTLREIYLPAFERVVTAARPWTVMCAYNKVNGTYASQHRWLLTEVLRDEWGFDGLVVSDWGAVHDRVAGAGRRAGPGDAAAPRASATARSSRRSPTARSPRRCSTPRSRRVLRARGRGPAAARPADMVDADAPRPRPPGRGEPAWCCCKNDGGLLPLRPAPGRTSPSSGSSPARRATRAPAARRSTRPGSTSPLDELRRRRCPTRRSSFAAGFGIDGPVRRRARSPTRPCGRGATPTSSSPSSACPPSAESEGFDRTHIDLPAAQIDLLGPARRGRPRRSSSCSPTARRCAPRRGTARAPARAGVLAGRPGRRRGDRRRAHRRRRTPAAGWPRRSRCGWRTPRRTSTSPARRATCATARACSSATAGYDARRPRGRLPVRARAVLHDVRLPTTSTVPGPAADADVDRSRCSR